MKTKNITKFMAYLTGIALLIVMTSCKHPKLEGTSWKLYFEMLALDDGPSIKETQILEFVDKTHVVLYNTTERSGYSASYMNADGTVNYTPGSTDSDKKEGTYVVNENEIDITIDGETTKYYLYNSMIIRDTEENYKKMNKYEREWITFTRM